MEKDVPERVMLNPPPVGAEANVRLETLGGRKAKLRALLVCAPTVTVRRLFAPLPAGGLQDKEAALTAVTTQGAPAKVTWVGWIPKTREKGNDASK